MPVTFCWLSATSACSASPLRREPEAVIDQFGVARDERVAQVHDLAVHRQRLHLPMGGMQDRAAGRFIHAARFHADEAVLDQVDAADAVLAAELVKRAQHIGGGELLANDSDADALARSRASTYSGLVRRVFGRDAELEHVLAAAPATGLPGCRSRN